MYMSYNFSRTVHHSRIYDNSSNEGDNELRNKNFLKIKRIFSNRIRTKQLILSHPNGF